ncbi:MAG: hypothetical protein P8Z37_03245, partial [Acidobacteriota bacterium]
AGADIVLLPTDVEVAINEIERAVERGDISASRIEASARRILEAKSRVGLVDTRLVPTDNLAETIGTPESKQTAQEIADHSITAIKDDTHLLPVNPVYAPKIYSLVLDSGLDTSPGFIFRNELRKYYPSMTSEWANSRIPNEQIDRIRRQAANSEMIICSTFARLSSGRDISAIPKEQQAIIKILIDTGKPLILIAFGNPYVLERFPRIGTYLCTFSDSEVSQIAAAKALSGAVPIAGRMPVSIPGHAATGDGLQIDPLEMKLKSKPEGTGNPSDITLINKVNNFINKDYLDNDDALCIVAGLKGFKILDICMDANGLTTGSNPDDSVRHKMQPELHSPDGLGTILFSMLSYESGRLLLDVPAVDYLPEFRGSDIGQTTVSDLLKDFQANHRINDADLSNENILNEIILRSCGSIDRLLSELPRDWIVTERTVLDADYVAGSPIWNQHSVSAEQIPVFLQTLLNKGIYEYDRIFKPATIDRFTNPGRGIQALGWQKPASGHWTGEIYSPGSFGYTDKSGLFVWVDPQTEFFIVLDFKTEAASPDTGHWSKAYESICNTILNHIQNR